MGKQVNLYFTRMPNSKYIFGNGAEAHFTGNRYATDDPKKIVELDNEVALNHPFIFTDPDNLVVDESSLDPMHELKEKIIAEYEAKNKIMKLAKADLGHSVQTKLNVADSHSIGEAASASDSGAPATPAIKVSLPSK
jgi:hypothetical protein